jgi:glycosyltransferase involved in cell wall biosynthesis
MDRNRIPEVTVLVAAYNGMPYLRELVDSVLRQTFRDFQLLIVNDGSTDGTEQYLNSLSDDRIRLVHQENRGQGAARNVGLALCESEFVAITDGDDVVLPNRLERQLRFLGAQSSVGMVGSRLLWRSHDTAPAHIESGAG